MRYCKVIVLAYHLDRIERGRETPYPHHAQHPLTEGDLHRLWQLTGHIEMTVDGGLEYDTVIICNGYRPYKWWRRYHNKPTKNGKFVIIHRQNNGGSFGGYNHAYKYTNYDAFLFTEDDILVYGDLYYRRVVDSFNKDPNPGYLCLVGSSKRESTRHCHGGVGYTARERLDENTDENGDLPHPKKKGWDQTRAVKYGEYRFSGLIREKGYNLVLLDGRVNYWSVKNCVMPYYLFTPEHYEELDFKV